MRQVVFGPCLGESDESDSLFYFYLLTRWEKGGTIIIVGRLDKIEIIVILVLKGVLEEKRLERRNTQNNLKLFKLVDNF